MEYTWKYLFSTPYPYIFVVLLTIKWSYLSKFLVPRRKIRITERISSGGIGRVLLRSFLRIFIRVKPIDLLDEIIVPRFLRYGKTHKSKDLTIELIWTAEPVNIQVILSEQQAYYDMGIYRRRSFRPLIESGLFSNDGEFWKRSRSLLAPCFKSSRLRDISSLEYHIQDVFAQIESPNTEIGWSNSVDLMELFGSYSFASASEFILGNSITSSLGSDSQEISMSERSSPRNGVVVEAIDMANRCGAARMRAERLYWLVQPRQFSRAVKLVRDYVTTFAIKKIEQHHDIPTIGPTKTSSVLDVLVKHSQDPIELRNESITLLSGAQGTSTSFLSFVILLLARHPEVFQRLRSDVITMFGTDRGDNENMIITAEQALALPYLGWVLNETLRLYPVVPITQRVVNRDTYLPRGGGLDGGDPLLVRKGQTVVLGIYMLHRREDIWGTDAEFFVPQRWENVKPGWEFIPFGGGPRKCIGVQYARIKTSFAIIRLLQRYSKIQTTSEGDSKPIASLEKSESAAWAAKVPKRFAGLNISPTNARVQFFRDSST